ncbi:MAG: substrate-binding domain-containing protein [Verrucomicrobiota bacterium]
MSRSVKKETVKLSFDQKKRATAVLRALIRSRYFGDTVPSDAELSRRLHIPRSSLTLAISQMETEGLIKSSSSGDGWDVLVSSTVKDMGTIGFIVNVDPLTGWYSLFQDWLIGFERTMHQERFQVEILSGFQSVDEKIEEIQTFRNKGALGIAFASRTEERVRNAVLEAEIPCVIVGNSTIQEEELGCVCTDNAAGVRKGLDYLLSQNHRNIAMYVTSLGIHDGFEERYHAYLHYMKQQHLAAHTELAFVEAHNELMPQRAADILLRMKRRPSAILCASDREAFELVSQLRHLKIEVPKEISILGFDNNHFGRLLDPPMTTIDIHASNMGEIAAHYLLNEMQAPQLPVKIQLPTKLVVRGSVLEYAAPEQPLSGPESLDSGKILGF